MQHKGKLYTLYHPNSRVIVFRVCHPRVQRNNWKLLWKLQKKYLLMQEKKNVKTEREGKPT